MKSTLGLLVLTLCAGLARGQEHPAATQPAATQPAATQPAATQPAAAFTPFWHSTTMEGEPILFVRAREGQAVTGRLLFAPVKVLAVRSSSGSVTYQAGKDYVWEAGSKVVAIPAGSAIPVATVRQLTPPLGSQPFGLRRRDGTGDILFGATHEYADMQVEVTYEHQAGQWKLPAPALAARELPGVLKKLQAGLPVKIVVFGDSISAGANASKLSKVAPFQPPYDELLAGNLERAYASKITLANLSVGGMNAAWGLANVSKVAAERGDLVVLAWGMNDSSGQAGGRGAQDFIADLQGQMEAVRKLQPAAEFILVSSMLPNPDCCWANPKVVLAYRDAMTKLTGPGLAVADVSSVWEELLKAKNFLDLTGNGVNHPNDFGHRVYAQVLSALLIRK